MTDRTRDLTTIALGVACISLLGGGGAALCRLIAIPAGHYFVEPEVIIWLVWGTQITGRIPGLLLGGALLGVFLRRISPWHVLAWIAAYMIGIVLLGLAVGSSNAVNQIRVIGLACAVAQRSLTFASGIGAVAAGMWIGQQIKHSRESQNLAEDKGVGSLFG